MTTLTAPRPSVAARRERTARAGGPRKKLNLVPHLFLGVLILYFLVPLWWLIVASTKDVQGLFSGDSALWFGTTFAFGENLVSLVTYNDGIYLQWFGNSLFYAVAGGLGSTALAVLAGYGFAKFRFAGRNFSMALLLGSVMVPLTALVIPTFVMMSSMSLTNTVWAVILPSLLNPFGVYLMSVYASEGIADDMLDAARVDGAGEFRIFATVALPLMRPAFVTVLLLSIVSCWNNYFLPLAMLSSPKLFPITVGIGLWQGQASANNGGGESLWSLIIIGSLMSIVPLVIAFLSLQRYWQGGLSLGSLK